MGESERVREREEGVFIKVCSFFFFSTKRGRGRRVTDEVCTTNDTETMSNYLQFKHPKGLGYYFGLGHEIAHRDAYKT